MITPEQAEIVKNQIGRHRVYYNTLRDRLLMNGYEYHDPLMVDVAKSIESLQSLWVALHYLSASNGRQPPDNTMAR